MKLATNSAHFWLSLTLGTGLTLTLVSDQGFGYAVALAFIGSLALLPSLSYHSLSKTDLQFIGLLSLYPVAVALHILFGDGGSLDDFDTPSRFILLIPVYLALRGYLRNLDGIHIGVTAGVLITTCYTIFQALITTPESPRISTFDNLVTFSQLAVILGAVSMSPWNNVNQDSGKKSVVVFVLFLFTLATVIISQTRSAALALILTAPFLYLYRHQLNIRLADLATFFIFAFLLIMAIVAFFDVSYIQRLAFEVSGIWRGDNLNTSSGIRFQLWDASITLIADEPLFGYGVGQFQTAASAILSSSTDNPRILGYDHAHSELLNAWVELGLAGPVTLLTLIFGCIHLSLKNNFDPACRHIVICVATLWLFFGITQTILAHQKATLLILVLLIVPIAMSQNKICGRIGKTGE